MNNNKQNPFTPDEASIHAYVDGCLDATDNARMEAWLDSCPERGAEIRAWRSQAHQLRAACGNLPDVAATPALDPAAIRARRRRRMRTRFAMAAMLVLALGVGGTAGWQLHSMSATNASAPMADAMQAYRMFAMDKQAQLDIVQLQAGQLQAWLNQHFPQAAALPNLDDSGFHPVGGRLVATASGPAAMVLYENGEGNTVSFYIRSPLRPNDMLPRGHRREGKLAASYWSGNGYNYALVSRTDATSARATIAVLDRLGS